MLSMHDVVYRGLSPRAYLVIIGQKADTFIVPFQLTLLKFPDSPLVVSHSSPISDILPLTGLQLAHIG